MSINMESGSTEKQRLLPGGTAPCSGYNTAGEQGSTSTLVFQTSGAGDMDEPCMSSTEARRRQEVKVLLGALGFCFFFMLVELFFGVVAHSLALLTDASHLLIDVGAYALSIMSLRAASRSLCGKYNYGWHRAEVIGTLVSVFSIWALVVWIVIEALNRSWSVVKCSGMHATARSGGSWYQQSSGRLLYDASNTSQLAGASREEVLTEALHMEICKSVDSSIMVVVGVLGMVVNLVCAAILYLGGSHGHSHFGGSQGHGHGGHDVEDETLWGGEAEHSHGHVSDHGHSHDEGGSHDHSHSGRGFAVHAALLHALGDCVQSLGVIIAGVFIYFANRYAYGLPTYRYSIYNLADPLCSLLFAVIALNMTRPLLHDLLGILMESTPPGIDYSELFNALRSIKGVEGVHDLHVWSIASDYAALSVHLEADNKDTALQEAQEVCKRFGINHTTIQVDTVENGAGLCHSTCGSAQVIV